LFEQESFDTFKNNTELCGENFYPMENREIIKNIAEHLVNQDISKLPAGLFSGKMGICVSLFVSSKALNDSSIQEKAESLLGEIIRECEEKMMANDISLETGLSGIALGIAYLAENKYVQADLDDVLKDFDDNIFRWIAFKSKEELANSSNSLYGMLVYLLYRIQLYPNENHEAREIQQELIILLINMLEQINDQTGYTQLSYEPRIFDITNYKLPVYLYIIAAVYQQYFYNYKLDRIIERLDFTVRSSFPALAAHRVLLLSGLRLFGSVFEEQIDVLERSIDRERMLREGFKDKSIGLNNGLSGLLALSMFDNNMQDFSGLILKKIQSSSSLPVIEEERYLPNTLTGLAGVALVLSIYELNSETP
jgi:hypothetical protein